MGLPIINLRKQTPMELVDRLLCIQFIKEIGAEKIDMIEDKYLKQSFLKYIEEEDGTLTPEIDWEFSLFQATSLQFSKLFHNFTPTKEKEIPEPKERIIIESLDAPQDNGQRPGLIL
jgi:hypothetical protein